MSSHARQCLVCAWDHLDLTRDPNPHLTFGLGTHYCLGAPLARLELALSLRALCRTLPGLRLADPEAPARYTGGFVIRGLERLRDAGWVPEETAEPLL